MELAPEQRTSFFLPKNVFVSYFCAFHEKAVALVEVAEFGTQLLHVFYVFVFQWISSGRQYEQAV